MLLRHLSIALGLVAILSAPAAVVGQQFSISASSAKVIMLADGRLAVLEARTGGVTITNLLDGDGAKGAAVDLLVGDVIVAFQAIKAPTVDQISASFDGLAEGTTITIGVRRDGADRTVTFARPAAEKGTVTAVSGSGGAAGAWVTAGGPSNIEEMVIAGAHIRNNNDGLPAVTHLTSDPAAATVALRAGDLITTINDQPLPALAGLELFYGRIAAGEQVVLTVTRGGQTVKVQFKKPAGE